jgi:glycosyltransferase involved in cell wall biosynthesis
MHVLFLHDAFPAQFGRVGLELVERYGWRCSYLVRNFTRCPEPSPAMLNRLDIHRYVVPGAPATDAAPAWPQIYGQYVEQCRAVLDALRSLPDLKPDLVVANGGRGAPTLFVPEVLDCPIITYCEYYFARSRGDLTYRLDLPPAEPAPFFPRVINAPTLVSLVSAAAGYSATSWQRDSFPARYRPKIEVHFDGVDDRLYAPGPRPSTIAGRSVPEGTKVVTYVARGLESVRGFDLFLAAADRIARGRPDVLFVVAGDERAYYGWDSFHAGGVPFKDWAMARVGPDPSRFLFLGHVPPETLAGVLRRSDLHLYFTVPFVASWSLFNALSTGLVVLGSDVGPVREVIEPGVTGLLSPLFDVDRLAQLALAVIDDPAEYAPLGLAGRRLIEERYGIDACIPPLRDFFERTAGRLRRPKSS